MNISVLGCQRQQLRQELKNHSIEPYRADQILKWVYQQRVDDWSQMRNLSAELRKKLPDVLTLYRATTKRDISCADGTIKALLQWPDGALTETVLMPYASRNTVCVSTQVGCPVGCAFCASGLGGLERSLQADEIVEQVLWASKQLPLGQRISNVVVMGMGEPLDNYEQSLKAIKIINADWAFGVGARHITLSTIGLPDGIRQLARESVQLTLAVSLHAATDRLRAEIIPWAKKIPLAEIFQAIDYYYRHTHREVTLEYILLDNVNCSMTDAEHLAKLANNSRCNVNLINYNPVGETGFQCASRATVNAFMARLTQKGVNVHLRRSLGSEIDAACGQLRRHNQ